MRSFSFTSRRLSLCRASFLRLASVALSRVISREDLL